MIHNALITTRFRQGIVSLYLKENKTHEIHYSREDAKYRIGDIYVAKVIHVAKNLNAAFVEVSPGVKCFLPFDKVVNAILINREYDGRILEQDEIVVQIEKAAVKTKDAVVTTMLNLVNSYFVFSINNKKIGYSKEFSKERKNLLKSLLAKALPERFTLMEDGNLKWSEEFGIVFRTELNELLADNEWDKTKIIQLLNVYLEPYVKLLKEIMEHAKHRTCYSCLYKGIPEYLKWLYRVPAEEIEAYVTDDKYLYNELSSVLEEASRVKLRLYEDSQISLNSLYGIESKVQELLSKNVWLRSGGYLVIEQTEALTVIDVNSGKNVVSKSKEEIIRKTNAEAAIEAMRQIKLRNISGIILIDFINNTNKEEMKELITLIKKESKNDFAKPNFIDVTALGLVEITRKKIEKNLAESLDSGKL